MFKPDLCPGPTTYKELEHSWVHKELWAWELSHLNKKNRAQRLNDLSRFKGDSAG